MPRLGAPCGEVGSLANQINIGWIQGCIGLMRLFNTQLSDALRQNARLQPAKMAIALVTLDQTMRIVRIPGDICFSMPARCSRLERFRLVAVQYACHLP
jgi:hypothetical protein